MNKFRASLRRTNALRPVVRRIITTFFLFVICAALVINSSQIIFAHPDTRPSHDSYPASTISSNLIAYYPFDGDYQDYSGDEKHGTNNNATFTEGYKGLALSLSNNAYVSIPVNINPDVIPQLTMTAWVKANDASRTQSVISHDNGDFDRAMGIDWRGGGTGWSAFSGSGEVLGYHPVTTGQWTFLAVVYDQYKEEVRLHVNTSTYVESGKLGTGWEYAHIGSSPSFPWESFNGFIDEVRIYNSALSASQIDEVRTSISTPSSTPTLTPEMPSSPAAESGLLVYYPFDGDCQDYSESGNHGTNVGGTYVSGISGQALSLDGANHYVKTQLDISPSNMPEMTVTAWVRPERYTGTFLSHDNGGYDRSLYPSDRGWAAFNGSGSVGYEPVIVGQWAFVAVVYDQDAKVVQLYVNDKVYEGTGTLGSGLDYFTIGINPTAGYPFTGDVDEFRLYNYALSSSQIRQLRNSLSAPGPTITTPTPVPTTAVTTKVPEITTTSTPASSPTTTGTPVQVPILTFESRSKAQGSNVQIPLTLSGAVEKIGNMDIALSYDSSVLEATEVIMGSLTGNSIFDFNILDDTILISLADNQGFSGNGSVAYIKFNVIGGEGSWSLLNIDSLLANRANDSTSIAIKTVDGIFTVLSTEETLSDCDGDGTISVLDALCALKMAVGKKAVDLSMDINKDGKVTSLDARQILKLAVDLEASISAFEEALADFESEIELCQDCVDAGVDVIDINNDGIDDKWVYSLIDYEVEEGLFVKEAFELEKTSAGVLGTINVMLQNTGNQDYIDYEYPVEIPKSFAATVDDLELPDSFEVTDPDPAGNIKTDCPKDSKQLFNFKANDHVHNVGQFYKDMVLLGAKKYGKKMLEGDVAHVSPTAEIYARIVYVMAKAVDWKMPELCDLIGEPLLGDIVDELHIIIYEKFTRHRVKQRVLKEIAESSSGKTTIVPENTGSGIGSTSTGSDGISDGTGGDTNGTDGTMTTTRTLSKSPGYYGMECLPGNVCNEGECQNGVCVHCGYWGEPCCYEQDKLGSCIDYDSACESGYCYHESDDCGHVGYKACEREGETYCYDGVVKPLPGDLTMCIACGDYEQPCCQNTDVPCDYGECRNPDGSLAAYPYTDKDCACKIAKTDTIVTQFKDQTGKYVISVAFPEGVETLVQSTQMAGQEFTKILIKPALNQVQVTINVDNLQANEWQLRYRYDITGIQTHSTYMKEYSEANQDFLLVMETLHPTQGNFYYIDIKPADGSPTGRAQFVLAPM